MALYENVFIARQDVPTTQVEALTTQFAELVTGLGGTVSKKEYWGLRSLAYRRAWFRLVMEPIEAVQPRASRLEPWLFGTAGALKHAARRKIASAIR